MARLGLSLLGAGAMGVTEPALTGKDGEPLPGTSVNVYVPDNNRDGPGSVVRSAREFLAERIALLAARTKDAESDQG